MNNLPEISRVIRSKRQAIAAYDRLSRWYDLFSARSEQPLSELGVQKLRIQPGESVLEIGYGTGQALLALANAVGKSGKVIGIDISRGMYKVAAEKIARSNLSQHVFLEQGDAAAIPFKASIFNAVFVAFTLELFDTPEIITVLVECRRVLKPAGRICVVAMARDAHENIPQHIYEVFHRYLPAYADCRPIYVQSALTQAGFQLQHATRKGMWGLPIEICLAQNP